MCATALAAQTAPFLAVLQTEHKCVLDSCRILQLEGFDVTYLPVKTDGLVCIDAFKAAIREDTVLASIMFVNNEIGVTQPITELVRRYLCLVCFHCFRG